MLQSRKRYIGTGTCVIRALFIIIIFVPIMAVGIKQPGDINDYKTLIITGRQLQAEKKFKEAYQYFKKANTIKKTGESYYCLGNILIDLGNYERAIYYYTMAYIEKYQVNNCLFNIACAYSLNKDSRSAMEVLLNNYREGDRLADRIEKDPDLSNFRKSSYYEKYKQILGRLNDGIVPETGDDILKYLFKFNYIKDVPDTSVNLNILTDPSPGTVHFYRDNKFHWGEGTVTVNTGTWQIDEKNRVLILTFTGIAVPGAYARDAKIQHSGEYFDKTDDLYYEKKPKEWRRSVIPFKDMRLNVFGIINTPGLGVSGILANYSLFGNPEKHDFISNAGWYIRD